MGFNDPVRIMRYMLINPCDPFPCYSIYLVDWSSIILNHPVIVDFSSQHAAQFIFVFWRCNKRIEKSLF
jgi:hypothetical protein